MNKFHHFIIELVSNYHQISCKDSLVIVKSCVCFQGQIGLEPVIVNGLLSADFYCRACEDVIFKGTKLTFTGICYNYAQCFQ